LDLAMLDRLDRRGAMVQVVAEGTARALRLPGEVALPPQDVAWQGELRAPVDRVGTATLERLAVSAGHLRLAAEGTFDASTLGGEARLELALDALAPLAEAYGQAITGSAALEGNLELSADAEVVSIDLYGRASELSGLPEGVGELLGAAPTLEANAVVAPDEGIEVTHLRVAGSAVTLDGRLDLTLPAQALDGALTLDLPSLAPLTPLVGVDLDGPLLVHAQLGGALAEPSVELTAQSPGLVVDGEHVDALGLIGQLEGTPEQAGGRLGLALTVRGVAAELASAFELRGRTLRLRDVSASAPATRLDGALAIDLERRLVDGELRGRIEQLQAFAPLLPVPLAGKLDLEARASAQDGAQNVTLALHGSDLAGDFGRL